MPARSPLPLGRKVIHVQFYILRNRKLLVKFIMPRDDKKNWRNSERNRTNFKSAKSFQEGWASVKHGLPWGTRWPSVTLPASHRGLGRGRSENSVRKVKTLPSSHMGQCFSSLQSACCMQSKGGAGNQNRPCDEQVLRNVSLDKRGR